MHPCVLILVEYDELTGNLLERGRLEIQADEAYFTGHKFDIFVRHEGVTPSKRVILSCTRCQYSLTSATAPELPFYAPHGHYPVYRGECNECSGKEQPSDSESDED